MQHFLSSFPTSTNSVLRTVFMFIILVAAIPSSNSSHLDPPGPKSKAIRSRTFDVSEVEITCKAAEYDDGTTCFNGSPSPNLTELSQLPSHIEKTALWYSVDNKDHVDRVRTVEKQCSDSCASKTCYYSLKQLDYVCGSSTSDEFYAAQKDMFDVEMAHFDYQLYPIGMICWSGELSGVMFDEFKTNSPDLQLAEWYGEKFTEAEQLNVERNLSLFCKTKQCEFIREKAAFMCTGSSPKTHPLCSINFLLLGLIILERFWNK